MSQIDKIIYIPLLFWFIILIIVLYFLIFSYFLTIFLTIFKVRVLYFNSLTKLCNNNIKNIFFILLLHNLVKLLKYKTRTLNIVKNIVKK